MLVLLRRSSSLPSNTQNIGCDPLAAQSAPKRSIRRLFLRGFYALEIDKHKLLRIVERKRPQQQRVGHGKYGGTPSDAQGERERCRKREARTLPQYAACEDQIL